MLIDRFFVKVGNEDETIIEEFSIRESEREKAKSTAIQMAEFKHNAKFHCIESAFWFEEVPEKN